MSLRSSWGTPTFLASSDSIDVTIPSGATPGDIAVVGFFVGRGDEVPVATPPDGSWTAGPAAGLVASRGSSQTFWKRLTSAETGTWTFDLSEVSNGAVAWAGLWSGRVTTGDPFNIATARVVDRVTQTATTGTALSGDDVIFGFFDYDGVAETVSGFTKAQEDDTFSMHLFYKDGASAGSVSALPSPASSSDTYWYTLLSLKAAGLTANAGPDQSVQGSSTVTLSGSASGGTGPYTYEWTQTAGTSVTLSSNTAQNPTFTAPNTSGILTFSLTVTDSTSATSSPDTVNVSVSKLVTGTPAAPVATTVKSWSSATAANIPLGYTTVSGNSLVAVLTVRNASAYNAPVTDDGNNLWQYATSTRAVTSLGQPVRQFIYYVSRAASISTLTLSFLDVNSVPLAGDGVLHLFEFADDLRTPLGVNQGGNAGTDPTTYGVAIASGSSAIVVGGLGLGVNNRTWSIASGWTSSGHDGTKTDVDQYAGYKIVSGPATAGPSWTRSAGAQTDSAQTTIAFQGGVPLPHASGGASQTVSIGSAVTLSGSATGGTAPYTYAWTQTQGPTVSLSSNTAQNPTFTVTTAGTYLFQLIVTDSTGVSSAPATAVVTVNPAATGTPLVRVLGQWVPLSSLKTRSSGAWH